MANTEEQFPAISTHKGALFQKKLELLQIGSPEIWEILINRQRICPCDFSLPNFCVPNPTNENCKKCWELAMKFDLNKGITVSKSGYLLCEKCKTYLYCTDQEAPNTQANPNTYSWRCPKCGTIYQLEYKTGSPVSCQDRPQGFQPAGDKAISYDDPSYDNPEY